MEEQDCLIHYGVLGMKWGVRRNRNYSKSGGVIPKGTTLRRISLDSKDTTYDNKKYVSVRPSDHKKWSKYLGKGYGARGLAVTDLRYKTVKDIKVMSESEFGRMFVKDFMNSPNAKIRASTIRDGKKALKDSNYHPKGGMSIGDYASLHFATQTKTGKAMQKRIKELGYDAVADVHGQNLAKDPLIILDPDKKLKVTRSKLVKKYGKRYGYRY